MGGSDEWCIVSNDASNEVQSNDTSSSSPLPGDEQSASVEHWEHVEQPTEATPATGATLSSASRPTAVDHDDDPYGDRLTTTTLEELTALAKLFRRPKRRSWIQRNWPLVCFVVSGLMLAILVGYSLPMMDQDATTLPPEGFPLPVKLDERWTCRDLKALRLAKKNAGPRFTADTRNLIIEDDETVSSPADTAQAAMNIIRTCWYDIGQLVATARCGGTLPVSMTVINKEAEECNDVFSAILASRNPHLRQVVKDLPALMQHHRLATTFLQLTLDETIHEGTRRYAEMQRAIVAAGATEVADQSNPFPELAFDFWITAQRAAGYQDVDGGDSSSEQGWSIDKEIRNPRYLLAWHCHSRTKPGSGPLPKECQRSRLEDSVDTYMPPHVLVLHHLVLAKVTGDAASLEQCITEAAASKAAFVHTQHACMECLHRMATSNFFAQVQSNQHEAAKTIRALYKYMHLWLDRNQAGLDDPPAMLSKILGIGTALKLYEFTGHYAHAKLEPSEMVSISHDVSSHFLSHFDAYSGAGVVSDAAMDAMLREPMVLHLGKMATARRQSLGRLCTEMFNDGLGASELSSTSTEDLYGRMQISLTNNAMVLWCQAVRENAKSSDGKAKQKRPAGGDEPKPFWHTFSGMAGAAKMFAAMKERIKSSIPAEHLNKARQMGSKLAGATKKATAEAARVTEELTKKTAKVAKAVLEGGEKFANKMEEPLKDVKEQFGEALAFMEKRLASANFAGWYDHVVEKGTEAARKMKERASGIFKRHSRER